MIVVVRQWCGWEKCDIRGGVGVFWGVFLRGIEWYNGFRLETVRTKINCKMGYTTARFSSSSYTTACFHRSIALRVKTGAIKTHAPCFMSQRYSNPFFQRQFLRYWQIMFCATATTLPDTRQHNLAPPNNNNDDNRLSLTSSPLAPPILIFGQTHNF